MKQVALTKQVLVCIAIIAVAFLGWQFQSRVISWAGVSAEDVSGQSERSRQGVPVIIASVETAQDQLVFQTVGTGLARQSVMLRSEAAGIVAESSLEAGKRFAKGEILLRLDDSEQRLALRLAQTRLENAERDRARLEQLKNSGTITTSSFDDADTAATLAAIEFETAKEALEDRMVRAPFGGVVGLPAVEPGERVEAGAELATFDDRRTLLVEFDLPEMLIARIDNQASVMAETPTVPDREFEGRIEAIDSRVNAVSRSMKVRAAIPNESEVLRPGASFTINLALPGGTHPVVPELALQFASGSLYVWRVVDNKAERVNVALVRRLSGRVLVDGELADGDQVVVEGIQRLAPERLVNVIGGMENPDPVPMEQQGES